MVTIAKWMSLLETKRFTDALKTLRIPFGELVINQVLPTTSNLNQYAEQHLIAKFIDLVELKPALISATLGACRKGNPRSLNDSDPSPQIVLDSPSTDLPP
ncbi:MAG: hypothetical protein H7126_07510 [Candidatus Parcubacteria bacterium]|nr:hypothetical protein [Leptolyngbyaceae cyanobacterium LF-bin-113]